MSLPRVSLLITGTILAGSGMILLGAPVQVIKLLAPKTELPVGVIKMSAQYGGLLLGLGAFFLTCLKRVRWMRVGLAAQGFLFGGHAAGWLVGMVLSRSLSRPALALCALDVLLALLAAAAYRRAGTLMTHHAPPRDAVPWQPMKR